MKHSHVITFNAGQLKIAAIVIMLIDHFAASVLHYCLIPMASPEMQGQWYEMNMFLRTIGRMAFPIFCFFIVEGVLHTHNIKKYAFRLVLFGIISEVPFDMALFGQVVDWNYQNVYWTLLIGMIVIALLNKYRANTPIMLMLRFGIILAGLLAANWLKTDYSAVGVAVIIALYFCRKYRILQMGIGVLLMVWEIQNIWIWIPIALFVLLLWKYDGTRGKSVKYFFYAFYPLHLFVFGVIRLCVQ